MPRKIVTFRDKYNSTTRLYPKVIMDSLTPEVKAYIEGQGEDKYVKKEEVKSQYKSSKILSEGDEISLLITDTESDMFGNIRISDSEFIAEVGTTDNDYYQISLTNTGDFAITTNDGTNTHQLTFDAEGNLKVDGQAVGGGKQLYQHTIIHQIFASTSNTYAVYLNIVNEQSTPMSAEDVWDYINTNGIVVNSDGKYFNCIGWTDQYGRVFRIQAFGLTTLGGKYIKYGYKTGAGYTYSNAEIITSNVVDDIVVEL